MLARFFIDRPIFAWVLSIVIIMGGIAALLVLPVAQYPEITPPTVSVTCQYSGASATVVADTVAAPIEQEVNGVENMLYMSSQCTNDGGYTLTVTFELGTDLNMAQVLVQNRVSQAMPRLPDAVKNTGVIVKKKSPSILLVVNIYSDVNPATNKPYFDQLYLSNYATIQLRDELARLKGVGDVAYLGQQDYSMRVWVNPDKLASRNMSAGEVVKVLREQNVQVAAGQIGQPPVPTGVQRQFTMTTLGRLTTKDQFERIVLKTGTGTDTTFLGDVGTIDLGAKAQDVSCYLDGQPSVGLAIYQLPGSNALEVAEAIGAKMKELEKSFPKNLKYAIVYDTTPFIKESVHEVFNTLRDAVILVALVVLVFLQDWKSLMLPLIDVAVSLIGTLAVMYAMGFSLNNLTLFGSVLAIGIVVDDAIVVLENIERYMAMGYEVREATIRAMDEITGPIIGITLVLGSVFLPSAFLGGITGQFYRQFALTIAVSMVISAINAMTMTPARATAIFGKQKHGEHGSHDPNREVLPWYIVGLMFGWLAFKFLKPVFGPMLGAPGEGGHGAEHEAVSNAVKYGWVAAFFVPGFVLGAVAKKPVNRALNIFFRGFNATFTWITNVYGRIIAGALRVSFIVLLIYGGLLAMTYYSFTSLPVGFIPSQDKGYLLVHIELPDAASLERTEEVTHKVAKIARETEGVKHTNEVPGLAFILNSAVSSNYASMFVILEPFHDRLSPELHSERIAQKIRKRVQEEVLEARVAVFGPPAVDGLGSAGGFKLMVEDRRALGLRSLQGQGDNLAEKANQVPGLVGIFNSFRAGTPQKYIDINREECKVKGVSLTDVFDTLQVYMGGVYVNDFNDFGRTWQVNVKADAKFRLSTASILQMKVRNNKDEMISLGAVAKINNSAGPISVTRYNMYPAATINGASLPGVSSGDVIKRMEQLSEQELAPGMKAEWTELTYMQILAGNKAIFAFLGAVILVFLVLSAQYESWSLPLAVILVVPMCLLSALIGIALRGMDINIFVQVGFVVLVGLACKNAILVVEFAKERQSHGLSAYDAAVDASKTRLRPIIMTSFAFILGVVPLVIGKGAGAEMRQTLGTAVCAGMLGVTMFGLFLTPVFYYVVMKWTGQAAGKKKEPEPTPALVTETKDGVASEQIKQAPH